MDPDQYAINEAANWDPTTETCTLTVNGEEVTMTYQAWSQSMMGTGKFANADFETKLAITAQLEEIYLKFYYRIPLCATTVCTLLSYQSNYYTEDYNIMYGFGGLRLMTYNYNDADWAAYVKSEGGTLNYN
jgi:oligopeptide transport system substrate-binding protein